MHVNNLCGGLRRLATRCKTSQNRLKIRPAAHAPGCRRWTHRRSVAVFGSGVRILKQIAQWRPDRSELPSGLAVDRLQEERTELLAAYRNLSTSLDAMSNFAGSQSLFADEVSEQRVRLQSIDLLRSSDEGVHCPLCQSPIPEGLPTTEELNKSLAEVTSQLETVSKERARLDRIIGERNLEMSSLRQRIRDKDNQIEVALAQNAQALERRDLDNQRSQIVGRVSLYLESLDTKEEQKDLRAIIEELLERVEAL